MIDLRLFRNQLFTVNLLTGFLIFVALAGSLFLMPFYLQNVLGYDTRQAGLLMASVPIGLGVTSPVSGSLSDRFGTRRIAVIGLAVLLLTYLLLSTLTAGTDAVGFILRFAPLGIGMGIFQSPNNSAVMGTAPRERLGVVSGLLAIMRTVGQTAGIAVLGAVWAGRAVAYAGGPLPGGATTAPIEAQVAALNEAYLVMAALVAVALGFAAWALAQERRVKISAAAVVESSTHEGA